MKVLVYIATLLVINSCTNSQEKIMISNVFGDMIDITTLVEDGEFKLDSCENRLEKIIRLSPIILTNNYEVVLQESLSKWIIEYNNWLKSKELSPINITIDNLYKKSQYQYTYFYHNNLRDVYRIDTKESISQVDNISFFFQLDKRGRVVDGLRTSGSIVDNCDSTNSVIQNIYKTKMDFNDFIVDVTQIDSTASADL